MPTLIAGRLPIFPGLLFAASLACSASARAQTAESLETARRLFREASELEQAHAWGQAAGKLREALAIKDTPGLRFHLAHCEEQNGELVLAERDYSRATELIQAGASAPDVEKLLPEASTALKARIPTLSIVLPKGSEGARVELDGTPIQPFSGQPLPVDPKEHRVTVTLPSGARAEQLVTLTEGEQRVLPLDPAAAPAPARVEPPVPPANQAISRDKLADSGERRADPTRGYVLLGESVLSLAGLGVGIAYAFVRSSDTDRATLAQRKIADLAMGDRAACATPSSPAAADCRDFNDALDARRRDGTIETIGFVTAGVSASALVASWLLWPKRSESSQALRYEPWLANGSVGLRGSF